MVILGAVTTIIGSALGIRSKTVKDTIATQKELITTLQSAKGEQAHQISKLQDDNTNHTTQIAELRGQVTVLRDIPLQSIAKDLTDIKASSNNILQSINQKGMSNGTST